MDSTYLKWIEIHMEAIEHNLREIRSLLQAGARVIAVVKAEAYGLGAVEIARLLAQKGVDYFGVTYLGEALELINEGIQTNILIFSPLAYDEYRTAIEHGLTVTIGSMRDLAWAEDIAEGLRRPCRIHIKLDTGLGRFGSNMEEALEIAVKAHASPNIILEGAYTHFSDSSNSRYTEYQYHLFQSFLDKLDELHILLPLRHCCNSGAFIRYPHMHLDAVRIGTLLSGQMPAGKFPRQLNLKNPYYFKSRILAIRKIKQGSYLGYHRTYRLSRDAIIGVVPVGLADGLGVDTTGRPTGILDLVKIILKVVAAYFNVRRAALTAQIKGRTVFIRGKVFMQNCLIELPPNMEVCPGDVVELPVKRTLASAAVPRVYLRDGQPYKTVIFQQRTSFIVEGG